LLQTYVRDPNEVGVDVYGALHAVGVHLVHHREELLAVHPGPVLHDVDWYAGSVDCLPVLVVVVPEGMGKVQFLQ
jgi:hypothetical protein